MATLKTLFLNPPSFENFDGGASSRWPATREIESYWYPVWLCYPAGMLPAAGQGALGIEVRADRQDLIDALAPLAQARDTVLHIGGKLNFKMGGPGERLDRPDSDGEYSDRRSVYGLVDRANLPNMLGAFDFARQ